jgi:hypothetical protein
VNAGHCQYGPRLQRPKPAIPTPPPKDQGVSLHQSIPWKPLGLSDSEERVLELRLIHEYTKSTCDMRSLGAMSPILGYSMWQVDIPQIAFSSDFVLNAVLGLSALHLQGTNPNDTVLARASLFYLDKAVAKHQAALDRADERTVEPLLVAAVLIAHHTWLSAHSKGPKERFVLDLRTYHMCNGIVALIQKFEPWLDKYTLAKFDFKVSPIESLYKERFMLNSMQDLDSLSAEFNRPTVPLEHRPVYESAAKEVIAVYTLITSGASISAIEQTIITYLHRVPPAFVSLLKAEDPIAMAMHARALCMLTEAEDSPAWWIHGAGEHKVALKSVLGIQGLMPQEWKWTMDWPVNVVLKHIDLYSDCKGKSLQNDCQDTTTLQEPRQSAAL